MHSILIITPSRHNIIMMRWQGTSLLIRVLSDLLSMYRQFDMTKFISLAA